jgi:RNA-directed DNA polymerase
MTKRKEDQPAAVPEKATQAGDACARWAWTEPAVWTKRMLEALEQGVKGGVWFSLWDKVYSPRNLLSAFAKVKASAGGPGADHVTIEQFERRLDENLATLHDSLRGGNFSPQVILRAWIPKPGSKDKRPLGIPTVRDRVVQAALRNALEPIFERDFAAHSYGFRPGRGCQDALRRVDSLLKQGYTWVVDADLKSYFDTIPHDKLLELVRAKVADSKVLTLLEAFLTQRIMEGLKDWTPEEGAPQGAVISPLLSNIYLDPLDHLMAERGFEMIRYADDFVVMCRSETEARQALATIQAWVAEADLVLHPEKTRVVAVTADTGFDFLGYHFRLDKRVPRQKSLQKLKDTVRRKTRRRNGHSLRFIIGDLNVSLRGWFAYFKHSHPWTFIELDKWIRMRLRSILRRRAGRRGRGRGYDHRRWPNAFFASHGLYSLSHARDKLLQSSRR